MFFNKRKEKQDFLDAQQLEGASLITVTKPSSPISEQFRTIRTNIQFSMIGEELKTIMFTSSGPWEGKSTVSSNIAVLFASQGKKVLYVDCDMRKPTVHRTFNLPNLMGLTNLLTDKSIDYSACIQHVESANLFVMTSGPKPPNPSELLNSNRMNEVIEELSTIFDLVIFDLPPVVTVTDAQVMATKTDGVVVVVRRGIADRGNVFKAKELLDNVNANVLGAVFNGAEEKSDRAYTGYYYSSEE